MVEDRLGAAEGSVQPRHKHHKQRTLVIKQSELQQLDTAAASYDEEDEDVDVEDDVRRTFVVRKPRCPHAIVA